MTREEALAYGNDYYIDLISACCETDEKHKEFVKMSLKALEQEPCEDCISRQAVIELIEQQYPMLTGFKVPINELPSVTLQPKTGHWIDRSGDDVTDENVGGRDLRNDEYLANE